jgi:hypothetical protein
MWVYDAKKERIVNKSITQYYKEDQTYNGVVQRRATEDMRDWDVLIKGNIKGEGFDLDAKRIAIEVMKSNGYKKFSKKYKFTKEDNEDMFTIIYYIITNGFKQFTECIKGRKENIIQIFI